LAIGLGWRKAQRIQKTRPEGGGRNFWQFLILWRQQDRDGRLRVINVECAASGNEFDQLGFAVVVPYVKREGEVTSPCSAAADDIAGMKPERQLHELPDEADKLGLARVDKIAL